MIHSLEENLLKAPFKYPVFFTFNIKKSVFDAFGVDHFKGAINCMSSIIPINVIPVINYKIPSSIDERAKYIHSHVKKSLSSLGADKCHFISFSSSGIDTRYLSSILSPTENYIFSITTIGTPNKGSRLAEDFYMNRVSTSIIEPITKLIGIELESFIEFNSQNILNLNDILKESKELVFSINAEKRPLQTNKILQESGSHLFGIIGKKEFYTDNDGIFTVRETKVDNHLLTFDADHCDLMGVGNSKIYEELYPFALQNIKFNEKQW